MIYLNRSILHENLYMAKKGYNSVENGTIQVLDVCIYV